MDDRYFFDKRNIKRGTKKYGLMMLFCLPILVGVNFLLGELATGWVIFIDVVLALFIIIVLDLIVSKIQEKKILKRQRLEEEEKLLKKVQERSEAQKRKATEPKKKKKKRRKREVSPKSSEE